MKWRRHNTREDGSLPSFLRTGLTKLNQWLIHIAGLLQKKTNSYSVKKKKILLLAFSVAFATESILVLVQSMNGSKKTPIDVSRIKTIPIQQEQAPGPFLTRGEFQKIQKFKNFIDSLSGSARGRKTRDSLLHNRPHLMDSIRFLLNLYSEQLKNSENEK